MRDSTCLQTGHFYEPGGTYRGITTTPWSAAQNIPLSSLAHPALGADGRRTVRPGYALRIPLKAARSPEAISVPPSRLDGPRRPPASVAVGKRHRHAHRSQNQFTACDLRIDTGTRAEESRKTLYP